MAKTTFVNAVGRLPYTGVVDKLACWLRFSHWCIQRGRHVGRYDEYHKGQYEDRYAFYETIIQRESLDLAPIDFLEFGVYQGASLIWWSSRISHPNARFIGFDSFMGLPERWSKYPPTTFSTDGKIPEISDRRCHFEVGLFQHTLPSFLQSFSRQGRLIVHLDADLYSSTLFALSSLAPILRESDLLFFDEFASPTSEFRAFDDFARAYMLHYDLIGAVNNFNRVCLRINRAADPLCERFKKDGQPLQRYKVAARGAS
jgi:O-methyltransferase